MSHKPILAVIFVALTLGASAARADPWRGHDRAADRGYHDRDHWRGGSNDRRGGDRRDGYTYRYSPRSGFGYPGYTSRWQADRWHGNGWRDYRDNRRGYNRGWSSDDYCDDDRRGGRSRGDYRHNNARGGYYGDDWGSWIDFVIRFPL
jgi:hypothetical protein